MDQTETPVGQEDESLIEIGKVRHLSAKFEGGGGVPLTAKTTLTAGSSDDKTKQIKKSRKTSTKKVVDGADSGKVCALKRNTVTNAWICSKCKITFSDPKAMLLECEICQTHTCYKCLKLTPTKYDAIARDDVIWLCSPTCQREIADTIELREIIPKLDILLAKMEAIEKNLTRVDILEDRVNSISDIGCQMTNLEGMVSAKMEVIEHNLNRVDILEDRMKDIYNIGDQMTNVEKLVSDVDSKLGCEGMLPNLKSQPSWADMITRERASEELSAVAESPGPQTKMKELVKEAMNENDRERESEMKERERRGKNVLIFRAEESESENRKEREEDDKQLVYGLIEDIGAEVTVKNITRLGKKNNDKCRPIRFNVKDEEEKSTLMSRLHYLRDAPEPFTSLVVSHDLTPKQRKEKQSLYEEAANEVDEGFRIVVKSSPGPHWDPKVVKLKIRH